MGEFLANLVVPRYQNNFHPLLLRKTFLAVFTVGILLLNIFASGFGGRIFAGSVTSSELVSLANAERSAAGLPTLRVDPRLVSAAHAKAQNIFDLQYWAHYGPNGESPWQFIVSSGYQYVYAGENLAKGFSSSEAVHSAWMASQTHRDNIMSSNYRDVGIAVVPGVLQGTEVLLVVQMFGSLEENVASASTPSTVPANGVASVVTVEPQVEILYPEDGSVLADDEFSLEGEASSNIDTLSVNDNETEMGEIITDGGVWDYRPEKGWEEGEHDVEVNDPESAVSASVVFEVDTTPPGIDSDSLSIGEADVLGNVEIRVSADETASDAVLIAGDFSITLVKDEEGYFSAVVPEWEFRSTDTAKVVVSDELGNFSELDVTEGVLGVISPDDSSGEISLGTAPFDVSHVVTRVAVVLIAILLVVDVVYLFKLKIVHTRGKTLLPMAVWLIVLGIAMVVGTGGVIL